MKKTFLLQILLWCLILGLALATFAQEKTRVDGRFSASNTQSNAQSQTIIPDLATIVRYDDGTNENSIGLTSGGTFEVSARFRPDQLGVLAGQGVTQVEIYINNGVTAVVVKIYGAGTPTLPGPVLYSQSHPVVQLSWNLITLSTPVTVDGNDLWVGYEVTHGGGTFPAGLDETQPLDVDGDWIYFNGAWDHLANFGLPGDWNIAAYVEPIGPPCPVGAPTNPSPANGAVDVPVSGNTAIWTNGAGTEFTEVWFGEVGNLVMVYDGAPIQSFSLAPVEPLEYFTDYGWRIVGKNDTCFVNGPTWTFTTIQDPNLATLFCDDFTAGSGNWTITNDGGVCIWEIRVVSGETYTLPPTAVGNCLALDTDDCNGTSGNGLSTATHTGIDASLYQTVWLEFDNDWQPIGTQDFAYVDVSVDGGATWQNVFTWNDVDVRNTHEIWDLTSLVALSNFSIRFKSVQPGWDWWWAVDNICIYATNRIPVELTSFTAIADYGVVELRWITATETNNQGFEVQRSAGGEFEAIAFVEGHGTTTQTQAYSYSDRSVNVGSYSYRLKQVDFDGTFEYSDVIAADVPAPAEFALDQNYPNPFNPSTKIAFRLAVDSKVSLKVFDILGQEVANLVNANLGVGAHSIDFDASSLNSGVYLYRIEATGIDGTNFVDVKKMILTK